MLKIVVVEQPLDLIVFTGPIPLLADLVGGNVLQFVSHWDKT